MDPMLHADPEERDQIKPVHALTTMKEKKKKQISFSHADLSTAQAIT